MRIIAGLIVLLLVTACSTPPAPVVDRSEARNRVVIDSNGQYRVKSGDSLYSIAFRLGRDFRDLAAWNGIRPPYTIYPDQRLRLSAPAGTTRPVASVPAASKSPVTTGSKPKPVARTSSGTVTPKPEPQATVQKAPVPAKQPDRSTPAANTAPRSSSDNGAVKWNWPVDGRLLRTFLANDPARSGLDIAATEGSRVSAAAAGSVVYSGNGLIGYGELIIIKHNDRLLSAYAHNRIRLVNEGDVVKAGQKIAEVGRNDRNQAVLHFEIREIGRAHV